jgi:hypothetical protein
MQSNSKRHCRLSMTALCLWCVACTSTDPPPEPCELNSSYPGYTPECSAVLAQFPEESRLQVDGRLTAFLPPDVQADTPYGGLSGNPLTILLDDDLAISRESTLTFGPDFLIARIVAVFDDGQVSGVLAPTLVDAD